MIWCFYISVGLLFAQILSLINTCRNYRYVLAKFNKIRMCHCPQTVLIVPCKGIDSNFHENISSLFHLDYEDYSLWFVVGDDSDPAYRELQALNDKLQPCSTAKEVQIHVAGLSETCGQKIHNLLHCVDRIPEDVEVLAFADSDICVRPDWLGRLVWPLRKDKVGVASGYRWFVPIQNNLASLALSALNAKVTQLLGNTRFCQVWGGSMALRSELFRDLSIREIWEKALSDDFSLSYAVRKAGYRIIYVPACLVASCHSTTWSGLFEFARRQFLITRIYAFNAWLFGLFGVVLSVSGLWLPGIWTVWAWRNQTLLSWSNHDYPALPLWAGVLSVIVCSQLLQAILRQRMICRLMRDRVPRLKMAVYVDIVGFWLWSIVLLLIIVSSAMGRTICWRGIRYRLLGPTQTIVLDRNRN